MGTHQLLSDSGAKASPSEQEVSPRTSNLLEQEHDKEQKETCKQSECDFQQHDTCTTPTPTPRSTQTTHHHQLNPLKLFSRQNDEESDEIEAHDVTIDCDVRESEVEDDTYKSKAAFQISKAIGTQKNLAEYDNIRVQLKCKATTTKKGVKPSFSEKKEV